MITRMLICCIALIVALTARVYAQEAVESTNPFANLDWRALLAMAIPAIWAAAGPLVMKYVTMGVNKAGGFVPRYIQIPLAAIFGMVAAAWTGDATTIANASVVGAAAQTYAGKDPKVLRTEPAQ